MKKVMSLVVSLIMVFSLVSVAYATETTLQSNAEELYPNAVYTIPAEELDSDGKWIYRELAIDGGFEEGYWNDGASVDSHGLDSTVKHSGNTSFKQTVSAQYKRMGVELDAALEANAKYRISYYVNPSRAVTKLNDRLIYSYPKPSNPSLNNKEDRGESKTLNLVANTWNFAAYTRTFTGGNNFGNAKKPYYSAFSYDVNDVNADNTLTIYLDDYSVRLVPGTAFTSYTKAISPAKSYPVVKNGDKVTFTFSLDIDSRTVTKENISVNGVAGANIDSVEVSTNESTRETTVAIKLTGIRDGESYTVSLDHLKDAWGGSVVGASEATVYCVESEGKYTIFEDLDSDGKWIYRELAIDGGFEEGYWNGNASVDSSGLDSTVKHSGNTSFKQTVSARYKRMGVELDAALEENAKYRISYYVNPNRAVARLNDRLVYGYPNSQNPAVTNLEDRAENKTLNLVANTWNFAAYTRTFTGGNNFSNALRPYYSAFSYDVNDVNADNTLTIYLDDYSVRRVPDEDFASVNLIGKSISADRRTVTFTFDKDIDSRLAVAENIIADGETVSAISVVTDEITRETTMSVTFSDEVDVDAVSYSNSLKDAWGREIKVKEQKLSFGTPVLSGNSFSVSDIENYSGKTVKLAAIIAGFNGNTMQEIKMDSVVLDNGETAASLTATLEENASNVRVFIWDMFTLIPYYAN